MSKTLQLLIISDGKPGHENQSLGLAEAMARQRPAETHLLRLDASKGILGRIRATVAVAKDFPEPDFIIATGHATHIPLLWLSRKYDARSILLMKPSLPVVWFDWCIAPEHDFDGKDLPENVITSKGALNRVVPGSAPKSGKLFLIGGPSKTHGYDEAALIAQIKDIAGDGEWQVADSRRTPSTFLPALRKELPDLEIFPHQGTESGWLAGKLASLETVWVTEDSVSMIYEALSGGAKVGVLDMPRIRPGTRVLQGLDKLDKEGFFAKGGPPLVLAEADRSAAIILKGRV